MLCFSDWMPRVADMLLRICLFGWLLYGHGNALPGFDFQKEDQRPNSKITKDFLWKPFFDGNETNEIEDELDPKIIGGREAQPKEFPWMVALHFGGRFICSAFLVSPDVVMTAAHCVEFENGVESASSFYGIVGNVDRNGPDTRIEFQEVAAHPDYGTSGSEGDIAVLRTTEPVQFSDAIKSICLPTAGRDFEFDHAQAMGWGVTSNNAESAPQRLMTTELNVQPRPLCRVFFAFMMVTITDRHVCATSHRSAGVCFGDSGGPLVYQDVMSGQPLAIGVASFVTALGCGRPFIPSVYTATAAYSDWIKETVGSEGLCFV